MGSRISRPVKQPKVHEFLYKGFLAKWKFQEKTFPWEDQKHWIISLCNEIRDTNLERLDKKWTFPLQRSLQILNYAYAYMLLYDPVNRFNRACNFLYYLQQDYISVWLLILKIVFVFSNVFFLWKLVHKHIRWFIWFFQCPITWQYR